ncbi:MAG: 50S ribosomal protein L17, partial [Lentisphaeria bacterium]|nr:50S ribosomal protein L17 [Lentisphaeria bacterium]
KAREIRRLAEKMITLGKVGSLHARRQAISRLGQPAAVAKLFRDIAPGFEDRQGGYTRILKVGRRIGDAAEMCILELVQEQAAPAPAEESAATEKPAPEKQDTPETT